MTSTFNESALRLLFRQRAAKLRGYVPEHMIESLERYTIDHIPTGDFLRAVLSNDLVGAAARADSENKHLLWHYVNFCYNVLPSTAWGSPERVTDWLARKETENVSES